LQLNVPSFRIVVIPNGVDLRFFHPVDKTEARLVLGLPLHSKVVLAVAQLIPRKGHHLLIQAVARLCRKFPKLRLLIVGDGDLGQTLRREVVALGLERHIFLEGAVKNEELFRWYSAADVTCLPSSREGLSCALLESLACGTPVVATAVGGTPELINSHDVGVLVQEDVSSISRGLERALQKKWDPKELTRHARRYMWEQSAVEIEAVLVRLVELNQKTSPSKKLVERSDRCRPDAKL
jgi:glycosyltransferase involved in cell wall biosynthesis